VGTPPRLHIRSHPDFGVSPETYLPALYPRLAEPNAFETTSDHTASLGDVNYNCIAWAAHQEPSAWWWPDDQSYWPDWATREVTVTAFREVFAWLGYKPCQSSKLERGFEKVALFVGKDDKPKHMARQLPDGSWTSKMGALWDIRHTSLKVLEQAAKPGADYHYGKAQFFFRRPREKSVAGVVRRLYEKVASLSLFLPREK